MIAKFNVDHAVHGVPIQYPIPGHLGYDAALRSLDPDKDVAGQ